MPSHGPVIVVAGASGYIGKEMIASLLEKFPTAEITALSRSQQKSNDARVIWKACDLFSLKSLEAAVPKNVDYALYLVHSMGPTAQLDQGSFADYDLILADNFSRIMKNTGLKQLIYLGGLIPDAPKLSLHLQSRLEVEETFLEHALPVTIFRAGLILGEAGSSFQILIKLVKRLPIMICPRWTQTLTTPVDLATVISNLTSATSDLTLIGKIFDLAGCAPLTYMEMMNLTAQKMGLRRLFLSVPFFTPTLSRLWVSLITNSSKDLIYPLIESLEHPMLARESHLYANNLMDKTYVDLLKKVSFKSQPGGSLFRFRIQRNTVRSVQRLHLPPGQDATWIKNQYIEWLPKFFATVIAVTQDEDKIIFWFFKNKIRLLELSVSKDRSNENRQLLYVTNGLLVSSKNLGRLEFRVVLNRKYVLAAIHDFKPALPWFIYKYTQAKLHLFVMNAFSKKLKLIDPLMKIRVGDK
ncbi:MAG: NAD-dependent epimerase/dehydratase family protein [Bdellovibrionaceae bacterium]|nr:NAD-dependent epimerase/dehydratase family protein [Pseudobdellovibrionaceae bacterium]